METSDMNSEFERLYENYITLNQKFTDVELFKIFLTLLKTNMHFMDYIFTSVHPNLYTNELLTRMGMASNLFYHFGIVSLPKNIDLPKDEEPVCFVDYDSLSEDEAQKLLGDVVLDLYKHCKIDGIINDDAK